MKSKVSHLFFSPSLKVDWEEVKKEMVEEKGLDVAVADKIGVYVKLHGRTELLDQLCADQLLTSAPDAKVGLEEMTVLLKYCKLFGILDNVSEHAQSGGYYCGGVSMRDVLVVGGTFRCRLTSVLLVAWIITQE